MKKLIKITTIIMTFFAASKSCLALSINKEDVIDGYQVHIKTAESERNEKFYKMVNEINNELVYSITPNISSFSSIFDDYNYDGGMNNLNRYTAEQIGRIIYFGYGYQNRTDIKWYVITQYLVWEELLKDSGEIYFIDENSNKIKLYEKERLQILEDVKHFTDLPSFFNSNAISYSFKLNEKIVLKDENMSLNNYDFYTYIPELNYQIDNNTITINSLSPISGTIFCTKKTIELDNNMKIYIGPSAERFVSRGNIPKHIGQILINVEEPKIIIKSTNQKFLAKGAKYNIYSEEGILYRKEITLNQNGESDSYNILPGKYYLEEVETPYGYEPNRDKIFFEIEKDDVIIEVTNNLIKKKVLIEKYIIKSNNEIMLDAHAPIRIYDENNSFTKELTTDDSGKVSVLMPYGTYKILISNNSRNQNNELFSFTIDDNFNEEKAIVIKSNEISEIIDEETEENNHKTGTGSIVINKIDAITGLPLVGIKYGLYSENKELIKEDITNNEGKIIFKDLATGKYYIKEILSNNSKELDENAIIIEVKDGIESILTSPTRSKIEVPDTSTYNSSINIIISIILIIEGLFIKHEKIK